MGQLRAVKKRQAGSTVRPLQAKVAPEVHTKAYEAAAAAGLSVGLYIETLILRDEVDKHGRPLWADELPEGQQELPLGA